MPKDGGRKLDNLLKIKNKWVKCNLTHVEVGDDGAIVLGDSKQEITELCLGHNTDHGVLPVAPQLHQGARFDEECDHRPRHAPARGRIGSLWVADF